MAIEQYTESITLKEMKCQIGRNEFGYVFPQGDVSEIPQIENLLKKAGGKPKFCKLDDFNLRGSGKAKPEYLISFNDDRTSIIVIECKKDLKKHVSKDYSYPKDYAVDGVLFYAKYLKEEYNVIAIAISGTKKEQLKINSFYWPKRNADYTELLKARDIILEPQNYLELVKGNKLKKAYSLDEIRETAIEMHDYLREIKVTESHKPIFIAGILIALNDEDFAKSYSSLPSYKAVMQNIQNAIESVLGASDIKNNRISYIKQVFKILQENTKFSEIPLGHFKSITWYIEQLEMKIKPMMDYADCTVDALGVFYHEFIKYSGGDGNGLGIVLTPQHLTEFMCELANINKNSRVVDICCGSASFLVTAMSKMFSQANSKDIEKIRKDGLYGVEFDDGLYTLAIANMIIRKDGKSNIYKGDCFNEKITEELKNKNINIGLINPPYSQKDKQELEFVEHLLNILVTGGTGVVVVPMSCAIGTKYKTTRERLLKKHTLKAVFSMPDDIFYPTATNVCVMVWTAHQPHDSSCETFFGFCKNDGFVKRKKLGRIDANNSWNRIKASWLDLYRNRDVKDGISARQCITYKDEWLCEAYMKTMYIEKEIECKLKQTVREYLAYKIKFGNTNLEQKYKPIPQIQLKNTDHWKEYFIQQLFDVSSSHDSNLQNSNSGETPYISSSCENNGTTAFVDAEATQKQNTLTVARNGSVGSTFYQPIDYVASPDDIRILKPKFKMNAYSGLFIKTIIELEKFKYAYGRKLGSERIKKMIIKLPSVKRKDHYEPDYEYMETYIRTLPYSERI